MVINTYHLVILFFVLFGPAILCLGHSTEGSAGISTNTNTNTNTTTTSLPLESPIFVTPNLVGLGKYHDKTCLCPQSKGMGFEFTVNEQGFAIIVTHNGHAFFGYFALFGLIAIWTIIQMVATDLILNVWQEMGV